MTWQIREIAVYGQGSCRRLPFEPGQLNLVTGRSQRGKSTILEIVDYCLLSGTCRIPKGTVRESLEAVGLLIESHAGNTLAIVRRLPKEGRIRRDSCWFDTELPNTLPPRDNRSLADGKCSAPGFLGQSGG